MAREIKSLKVTKNQGFSLENTFFKKTQNRGEGGVGWGQIDFSPVFLGLSLLFYVYYVNHSKKPKFIWLTPVCMYLGWYDIH